MMTWVNSILEGFRIFGCYALPVFVPVTVIPMILSKKYNLLEVLLKEAFILYMCCVVALVFLPLPSMEKAANLSYQYQLIPLYSIISIKNHFCAQEILQVVFNVIMTIPFGMYLKYYYGMNAKKVLLYGIGLTVLIEVGQLTGLFFIFKGSYRLFDVDDLICNTMGAMIGYWMVCKAWKYLPDLESFDREIAVRKPVMN